MSPATLELTTDQKKELSEKLGMICDELILSFIPKGSEIKVDDLDAPVLLALGKTFTVS
ncbi:hypothetical protein [Paramaledivibacter caminithermalis]|jgi:hypothetical protein|uniref:Uncharacterized protein n=1 Tax=Paramaledivibacter caminithermalis (strain DSM 15212 / CIP 107654 / DViRD3) TaxID=1121301 RepID=A0A1M6MU20_PARC5|nr:hypothetical protein [Paramaledivibacter caminithermalis]SHJ86879.1 hypothetical protein SAMN02745912_01424 [Paramaledivibacter caminithermalis DSM 15212]